MAADSSNTNIVVILAMVILVLIGAMVPYKMDLFGDDGGRGREGDHRGQH